MRVFNKLTLIRGVVVGEDSKMRALARLGRAENGPFITLITVE